MGLDEDISVETVRKALADVDATAIPEPTIELAIAVAEEKVEARAAANLPDGEKRVAILDVAAYRAFNRCPQTTQKDVLDASKEWDVEDYLAFLKENRDNALEDVKQATDGYFFTVTGSGRSSGPL